MIGAYLKTEHFAYPGWRLTIPGGPAGGHYKGFTHTQAAGTDLPPQDAYEQDREDGMSSHDAVHASPQNPRGVYRSSAEVPPRPNASGAAMTYRAFQTERHAGTSVAPGSFPAEYIDTNEDAFLHDPHSAQIQRGYMRYDSVDPSTSGMRYAHEGDWWGEFHPPAVNVYHPPAPSPVYNPPAPPPVYNPPPQFLGPPVYRLPEILPVVRPNTVPYYNAPPAYVPPAYNPPPSVPAASGYAVPSYPAYLPPASSGATSTVRQTPPTPLPLPPSPAVTVQTQPPVSPTPAPTVATHDVVPKNDGSGNFVNVSTGATVPPSNVAQNPATGQLYDANGSAGSGVVQEVSNWLHEKSIVPSLPNWAIAAGVGLAATMFMGGSTGRRR